MDKLTDINKTAHLLKKETGCTWSSAMKSAWAVYKLKAALSNGVTEFMFRKKDGSLRPAKGTTNQSLFQYEYKGIDIPTPPTIVRYFDLDVNEYRSFDIRRLVA